MLQHLARSAERLMQQCVISLGMSSAKLSTDGSLSVVISLSLISLMRKSVGIVSMKGMWREDQRKFSMKGKT